MGEAFRYFLWHLNCSSLSTLYSGRFDDTSVYKGTDIDTDLQRIPTCNLTNWNGNSNGSHVSWQLTALPDPSLGSFSCLLASCLKTCFAGDGCFRGGGVEVQCIEVTCLSYKVCSNLIVWHKLCPYRTFYSDMQMYSNSLSGIHIYIYICILARYLTCTLICLTYALNDRWHSPRTCCLIWHVLWQFSQILCVCHAIWHVLHFVWRFLIWHELWHVRKQSDSLIWRAFCHVVWARSWFWQILWHVSSHVIWHVFWDLSDMWLSESDIIIHNLTFMQTVILTISSDIYRF